MSTSSEIAIESFPIGSYGCNCSVIFHRQTKEAIIIDPGNDAETIMEYIAENGLKVKKLLHTHAHFDHIGQSGQVKKLTGATMHLHQGDLFLYEALPQQSKLFGQPVGEVSPIDEFLQAEQEFKIETAASKSLIKTIHTPGHTPGSCCFYTEILDTPILFAGDTLFQRSIGRTDLPGGDYEQILRSIKQQLFTLPDDTMVVTGHGPATRIFEEKRANPFVR